MTIESSIFNDAGATPPNTSGTPAGAAPGNDELTTMLASIKNPQGEQKYKTVKDALNALGHSQNFIPELQHKVAESEAKLNAAAAQLQELEALKSTVAQLTERLTIPAEKPSAHGMSESDIAGIVERQLAQKQAQASAASNTKLVIDAVKQKFGDKAGEVFYGKAQELGMSQEQINALAASSPQAVLTMLGISAGAAHKQAINPPPGYVNTTGFSGTPPKSFIGRETNIKPLGSTHQDMMDQMANARKMAEEMEANGIDLRDLLIPSNFYKHFGN